MTYDKRHGGPYDRGSADRYYRRAFAPHYYAGGTGSTPRIEKADMTEDEIQAYTAGWDEEFNQKEY